MLQIRTIGTRICYDRQQTAPSYEVVTRKRRHRSPMTDKLCVFVIRCSSSVFSLQKKKVWLIMYCYLLTDNFIHYARECLSPVFVLNINLLAPEFYI